MLFMWNQATFGHKCSIWRLGRRYNDIFWQILKNFGLFRVFGAQKLAKIVKNALFPKTASDTGKVHIIMIVWVLNGPKYQPNPQACLLDTFPAGKHDFEAFLGYKAKSPIFTIGPKMSSPVQKMRFCTDFLIFTRVPQQPAMRSKNEIWVVWTKRFRFSQLWMSGKGVIWSKSEACSAQRLSLAKNGYFSQFFAFCSKTAPSKRWK